MAVTICYLLRLSSKHRAILEKYIKRVVDDKHFDFNDFEETAKEVSDRALKIFGQSGNDVSANKPLRENLLVVLTCITLGIPSLICGKPGTSKTLAVDIAKSILAKDLGQDDYLQFFRKARFSQFYGSVTTTSDGVNKKFLSLTAQYINVDKARNEAVVLVFDEIGLAELSPDNPNKVLHSYLDPGSEDRLEQLTPYLRQEILKLEEFKLREEGDDKEQAIQNKIKEIANMNVHFVGISNWKLDVSKQNRMIFVARGNMGQEDLVATSESIFEAFLKENEDLKDIKNDRNYNRFHEAIMGLFEIISNTYITFRER